MNSSKCLLWILKNYIRNNILKWNDSCNANPPETCYFKCQIHNSHLLFSVYVQGLTPSWVGFRQIIIKEQEWSRPEHAALAFSIFFLNIRRLPLCSLTQGLVSSINSVSYRQLRTPLGFRVFQSRVQASASGAVFVSLTVNLGTAFHRLDGLVIHALTPLIHLSWACWICKWLEDWKPSSLSCDGQYVNVTVLGNNRSVQSRGEMKPGDPECTPDLSLAQVTTRFLNKQTPKPRQTPKPKDCRQVSLITLPISINIIQSDYSEKDLLKFSMRYVCLLCCGIFYCIFALKWSWREPSL